MALFLTAGCSTNNTNTINTTSSDNSFNNQESSVALTLMQTNLARAKVAATEWQKDANFVALNFVVPGDLKPESLNQTFVFSSAKDKDNWYTYSIDFTGKFIRAIIPKTDFLDSNLQPIQESFIKKNYVEILRTADENGGTLYKAKYPETKITVTLSQGEPNNWTWYTVEYQSTTDSQKIRISANDGLVYDEAGNPVTK